MAGGLGTGIRLPRKGAGQSADSYLDTLAVQIELALQKLATKQGAPPAVSGSCGGNAALASLVTALAGLGLITNNTTP